MSSAYQPFESLPPRKLQLHHRFILLCSGTMSQMGWIFVGLGSFFVLIFGLMASISSADGPGIFPLLFCLLFPVIGMIFVFGALKRNFKTIDLITNGKFASGKVVKQSATNVKINDQTVYEYTVRFKADDGKDYEVSSKTHLSHRIGDEAEERVLYLSADPSWGSIFDTIPNQPQFLPNGVIKSPHWSQLFTLIIPSLGLLSFLAMLYGSFAAIRIFLTI
ncbi:MAG: DUF3592 domain-containing protein [Bacteroidia bacterium]